MYKKSTLFLKIVVLFIGIAVLAFCIIVLPVGIRAEDADGYRPILIGTYLPAILFLTGIYQAFKLLGNIDAGTAFSELSVRSIKIIKYCAFSISLMYAAAMPYIYIAADKDDAPGVILLGLIFTFAPFVVATFAAVFQKLVEDAIYLKSENDLTV